MLRRPSPWRLFAAVTVTRPDVVALSVVFAVRRCVVRHRTGVLLPVGVKPRTDCVANVSKVVSVPGEVVSAPVPLGVPGVRCPATQGLRRRAMAPLARPCLGRRWRELQPLMVHLGTAAMSLCCRDRDPRPRRDTASSIAVHRDPALPIVRGPAPGPSWARGRRGHDLGRKTCQGRCTLALRTASDHGPDVVVGHRSPAGGPESSTGASAIASAA